MTLESGRWSLDKGKRKRPCRFDGHKTGWRSGIFSAAQLDWLMTLESGRWSLDKE
ncbi:hypothetical protein NCCP2050_00940 [Planococcus sp. NCCP-2050]|nr:hypothetical protein NCCP2050_00940 [Planococcus sp. NCCP-2050]